MATFEELETWSVEAANSIRNRIGNGAQVIVIAFDPNGKMFVEHRSDNPPLLIYALEVASKVIKDRIFPKTAYQREGDGT